MTHEPRDDANVEIEKLRFRLHNLRHLVGTRVERTEKRRKAYLIAGAVLAAACTVCLSSLTFMAFKLDAHALTQIGRLELERQLPSSRENLKNYLQAGAPDLTRQVIQELLAALPQLRPLLLSEVDANLRAISEEFERQLLEELRVSVAASKIEADREYPAATEAERIEKLVQPVVEQFQMNVNVALQELYPKYSAEMNRVEDFLVTLRDKDKDELTKRQRTQKELIETVLRLIIREKEDQPQTW